jgi:dTMP kinase
MVLADKLPGLFIALEGLDGSGKTTIAARMATAFRSAGREVILTREPGGTTVGNQIRNLVLGPDSHDIMPETEVLLFAADRAQHVAEVIRPGLNRGAVVISDRFVDSSLAYQWGGRGLSKELVFAAQRLATGGLEPHLKLFLDLPIEVALARRLAEDGTVNRLDKEKVLFHERVRAAYLSLSEHDRDRWRKIDATRSVDAVWADVVSVIEELHDQDSTFANMPGVAESRGPL